MLVSIFVGNIEVWVFYVLVVLKEWFAATYYEYFIVVFSILEISFIAIVNGIKKIIYRLECLYSVFVVNVISQLLQLQHPAVFAQYDENVVVGNEKCIFLTFF